MKRIIPAVLFAALSIGLGSCARADYGSVEVDPTPVLSGGIGWGVVTIAYSRLLAEPTADAAQSGYARRGEVMLIEARARKFSEPGAGVWYRVSGGGAEGWIHEQGLRVFTSRARALNAPEARP